MEYKYDVAISFLQGDEPLALELAEALSGRLKVFVYSLYQSELVGQDGQNVFSDVFAEQARVVVVLYRGKWGHTTWTKVEETAIKNRTMSGQGWDFFLMVNMDKDSNPPNWVPTPYIWYDYNAFSMERLLPIIQNQVIRAGGHIEPETVESEAARLKFKRESQISRREFLRSNDASKRAFSELESLFEYFKSKQDIIEHPETYFRLGSSRKPMPFGYFELAYNGIALGFNNFRHIERNSELPILKVALFRKHNFRMDTWDEEIIEMNEYFFNMALDGRVGWSTEKDDEHVVNSKVLVNDWVKKFIRKLSEIKDES